MVVDLAESHVTLAQLNFNAPFIERHLHQYHGLADLTRDLNLAEITTDIHVGQDHVSRYAWHQLLLSLKTSSMPHAIIAEQGRVLLRLYAERLADGTVQCKRANSPGVSAKEEAMAARVRKLIEADLRAHHSLEALAQETGWNVTGIKEIFPKLYGRTPYQHLLYCRMNFAKDRVLSTCDPIKVVAIDCGYRQEHHFIKRFRQTFGITPGAMRKGLKW
jgi:AraC-like DNA-binding protein